jgi:predicted DNA-binding transcriptional regulator AlpA
MNAVTATATEPPNDRLIGGWLIDVRQLAQILGCSVRHVHRLNDRGDVPAPVRLGALLRWRRATIESWIADGCKPCRR